MIADLEDYLNDIKNRFSKVFITVDQDWLVGCVEYFLEETPQITFEDMYKKALEQWQLSDIVEIGVKCLPDTVQNSTNEFELNGKYVLQMQYLIDIAESAYDQLRNLYNQKLDEPNEEPEQRRQNVSKKKRVLKLEMTDGHIYIVAMEHSPNPCLNTKLSPGIKILLTGPIRCVNKVLFLKPENVKILGGEVEKLLIENAFENVLLKALGRPINPTPKVDYQEAIVEQQSKTKSKVANIPAAPAVSIQNPPTSTNVIHDDDDELFSTIDIDFVNVPSERNVNCASNQNTNPVACHSTPAGTFFDDDDDDIFFEANIPDTVPSSRNQEPSSNAFDDDDSIDMMEIETNIQIENRRQNVTMSTTAKAENNVEISDSDLDVFLRVNDIETFSNDITDHNYEFKIMELPLSTILQLHSIDENEKSEKSFVVKCEILSTVEKLRFSSNQFQFRVLLADASDMELEVKISNDVIAKWGDTTSDEIQKIMSMRSHRQHQKEKLQEIRDKVERAINDFNGFMKVEYSRNTEIPEVIEVIETQSNFEDVLRRKLAKEV